MNTSKELFEKLENDISAKNAESVLEMLASVIRRVLAQIPVIRIFIATSLEGQYYELSNNIAEINKEVDNSKRNYISVGVAG